MTAGTGAAAAPPVIELQHVGRVYGGPPDVEALCPVSVSVPAGDYVAVVGPSGSGKSTLLNILGLLDRPTSGRYLLNGVDVSRLGERRRAAVRGHDIGFVFQSFHLLPRRTALENVMLAQLYNRTPRSGRLAEATTALQRVGLDHRLQARPTTMSGGERQRVAIARAVVHRPSVLLCDEPTGNLDSATSANVLDLLQELNGQGLTVVVITHDPDVADRARRVLSMSDGVVTDVR